MSQLKIAAVLLISIVLQLSLRAVWKPLAYIDFPLVIVVYIALQRDAWQALVVGTLAGLIVELLLLTALAWTVGLSGAGWVVGVVCGLIMNGALALGLSRYRADRLSQADWVTLARGTLAIGVTVPRSSMRTGTLFFSALATSTGTNRGAFFWGGADATAPPNGQWLQVTVPSNGQ